MARVIKAGVLYFLIVFSAGFLLGTVRTLFIVPRLGARTAELIETPIMIAVSFLAAQWIIRRLAVPFVLSQRLGIGATALVLLLAAEFGFVLWLRGISLQQYFGARDPVSGTVYYLSLVVFALAPLMVERKTAAGR